MYENKRTRDIMSLAISPFLQMDATRAGTACPPSLRCGVPGSRCQASVRTIMPGHGKTEATQKAENERITPEVAENTGAG
jgi:hypothetical protein